MGRWIRVECWIVQIGYRCEGHGIKGPLRDCPVATTEAWCGRRDSNPQTRRHQILNLACLPVPPRPRSVGLEADPSIIRPENEGSIAHMHERKPAESWPSSGGNAAAMRHRPAASPEGKFPRRKTRVSASRMQWRRHSRTTLPSVGRQAIGRMRNYGCGISFLIRFRDFWAVWHFSRLLGNATRRQDRRFDPASVRAQSSGRSR